MRHLALIASGIIICILHFTLAGYDVNGGVMGENDIFMEEFDGNMKYQQCKGLKSTIKLNSLEANPKQFFIPQNVSLSIDFKLIKDLLPPVTVEIKISKELPIIGYIKIPCIANYGSCTFENGCEILEKYPKDSFAYQVVCPSWLKATGIQCKCPFRKGHYKAIDIKVPIEETIVPKWIATGDYKAVLLIHDSEKTAGCFKFQFRLS